MSIVFNILSHTHRYARKHIHILTYGGKQLKRARVYLNSAHSMTCLKCINWIVNIIHLTANTKWINSQCSKHGIDIVLLCNQNKNCFPLFSFFFQIKRLYSTHVVQKKSNWKLTPLIWKNNSNTMYQFPMIIINQIQWRQWIVRMYQHVFKSGEKESFVWNPYEHV